MYTTGDAAFRTLRTGVAIVFFTLSVGCERQPSAPDATATPPQPPVLSVARARVIELDEPAIANPAAVAAWSTAGVPDLVNMAFDDKANRTLVFEPATNELIEMQAGPDGGIGSRALRRTDARRFGLRDPRGFALDAASGRLFVLDAGPRVVRIVPHPDLGFERAVVSTIDLAPTGLSHLRGLAFDPSSGHLHVLDPVANALHEISQTGRIVATRDVAEFRLHDPQAMAFGPSGDATDDPSELSLYVAAGGRITELSLAEPVVAAAATATGTLVRTTETWRFSPPSPDPSGVTYADHLGSLIIGDGEVDEMSIYAGGNVFETTPSGSLSRTWTTTAFSNEPTGSAYNPANRHLFLSDDDKTQIFEVDPGPDGRYGTSDDRVTSFDTAVFGCTDPEGVAFDDAQGVLFIADGVNAQVWRVSPGANGVFDGVSPAGDDQVTNFDTQAHGLLDPEGIAYDSDFGHVYVVGKPATLVFHFSSTGSLLRTIDISAAQAYKPAGLAYAPGSANSGVMTLYIVDRGVDNNDDPRENDGKMYEVSLPPLSGNTLPSVTITAPPNGSSSTQGSVVTFTGTASDAEDGNLTAGLAWTSSLDGALGSGGSVSTSTLSSGTHTITASVTDGGGAQASAAIAVTVNAAGSGGVVQVRVAAGADDAEESASGSMYIGSSDLELVYDGNNQTVGLRFNAVTIPPGATITRAYVQFQVDEATSVATSLTIRGQATDNAAAFSSSVGNISSRSKTVSAVSWSPVSWTILGQAGTDQQTPSIVSLVQEIVNRPGWRSGNSLGIIITGTGSRVAEAYEGVPSAAPLLRVEYSTGSESNTAPTATNVTISGTAQVGQVLTGNYTYSDADGDAEGSSGYHWLRNGATITGATALSYTLVAADEGALIVFEVTPAAAAGASPGTPAQSPAVGPVIVGTSNSAPTATGVAITGTAQVGRVLTGDYTYSDPDGDAEGSSTYRWLRDGAPISGATGRSYTLVTADQGALIAFEVTPVAATGASPGSSVQSATVGPVSAAATVIVSTVSPSTIVAGSSVHVTISGSGFASGAGVTVENGTGGPAPSVTSVVVVDATTLTATVTTKQEGPKRNRVWDVRVTNADGSTGALARALTITP